MPDTIAVAFKTALARCEAIREETPDRIRVRVVAGNPDTPDAVRISATIMWASNPQLAAVLDHGTTIIPWAEIEAHPGRLVEAVDETADRLAAVLAALPPPPPRPRRPGEEYAAFLALTRSHLEWMLAEGQTRASAGPTEPGEHYMALAEAACAAAAHFGRRASMDVSWLRSELNKACRAIEEEDRASYERATPGSQWRSRQRLH